MTLPRSISTDSVEDANSNLESAMLAYFIEPRNLLPAIDVRSVLIGDKSILDNKNLMAVLFKAYPKKTPTLPKLRKIMLNIDNDESIKNRLSGSSKNSQEQKCWASKEATTLNHIWFQFRKRTQKSAGGDLATLKKLLESGRPKTKKSDGDQSLPSYPGAKKNDTSVASECEDGEEIEGDVSGNEDSSDDACIIAASADLLEGYGDDDIWEDSPMPPKPSHRLDMSEEKSGESERGEFLSLLDDIDEEVGELDNNDEEPEEEVGESNDDCVEMAATEDLSEEEVPCTQPEATTIDSDEEGDKTKINAIKADPTGKSYKKKIAGAAKHMLSEDVVEAVMNNAEPPVALGAQHKKRKKGVDDKVPKSKCGRGRGRGRGKGRGKGLSPAKINLDPKGKKAKKVKPDEVAQAEPSSESSKKSKTAKPEVAHAETPSESSKKPKAKAAKPVAHAEPSTESSTKTKAKTAKPVADAQRIVTLNGQEVRVPKYASMEKKDIIDLMPSDCKPTEEEAARNSYPRMANHGGKVEVNFNKRGFWITKFKNGCDESKRNFGWATEGLDKAWSDAKEAAGGGHFVHPSKLRE